MRAKATATSKRVQVENGIQTAVKYFHEYI